MNPVEFNEPKNAGIRNDANSEEIYIQTKHPFILSDRKTAKNTTPPDNIIIISNDIKSIIVPDTVLFSENRSKKSKINIFASIANTYNIVYKKDMAESKIFFIIYLTISFTDYIATVPLNYYCKIKQIFHFRFHNLRTVGANCVRPRAANDRPYL